MVARLTRRPPIPCSQGRLGVSGGLRFLRATAPGTFEAAARELHVTQGAVSHQVKALEEHLGYPLFKRMTRKLGLTEQGRVVLALAQPATYTRAPSRSDGREPARPAGGRRLADEHPGAPEALLGIPL